MNADTLKREAQKFIDEEIRLLKAGYPERSDDFTIERFANWGYGFGHSESPHWWNVGQSACSAEDRVFKPGADAEKIESIKDDIYGWVSGAFYESGYYRGSVTELMHKHRIMELSEDASDGYRSEVLQAHAEGGCFEKNKSGDGNYLHQDTQYKLTLGMAQKALGYHLKFVWCIEIITDESSSKTTPPHCLIDDVTLEAVGINKKNKPKSVILGDLNCIGCYEKIIDRMKQARDHMQQNMGENSLSLAEWELVVYNANR